MFCLVVNALIAPGQVAVGRTRQRADTGAGGALMDMVSSAAPGLGK